MGSGTSRHNQIANNESLQRFVSPETLFPGHPFWNSLLSFSMRIPRTKEEWKILEEVSEELLKRFATNNLKSGNFGNLIQVFLSRVAELDSSLETDSSMFVWQTFNALYLLRVIIKFFTEKLKEEDVFKQFCAQPTTTNTQTNDADRSQEEYNDLEISPGNRYEALVYSLTEVIVKYPACDLTYGLQNESINILIALLSTPMFLYCGQKPSFQLRSFRTLMKYEKSGDLTRALLNNFIEEKSPPATYLSSEGGSFVLGIASGFWNILTLGYNNSSAPVPTDSPTYISTKPLSESSLILLLILVNHCTDPSTIDNPYRSSIFEVTNSAKKSNNQEEEKDVNDESKEDDSNPKIQIDFGLLYRVICRNLESDESTLLLYLLLHKNSNFKSHVLASSEIESIILPILKTLYFAPESSNHHIYMSLIILLILSEDELFSASVHDINLKNIDWYTERQLQEISLGGLLILVVIRTIQYNMLKMRDKYLHTNCLAALANMSGQFKNLHPYVSQRIVSMFEALSKKHARLISTLKEVQLTEGEESSIFVETRSDITVLEEVLRMILEIINSCLVNQIKSNSNLVYTLLYKKQLFEPFETHVSFQDISQNLQTVIRFFNTKLEQVQEKSEQTLAVHEVQEVIRQTAMQFPKEKLAKFPDLKFVYIEEEQPEDFFVPYIWTLAMKKIYWNESNVKLIDSSSNNC